MLAISVSRFGAHTSRIRDMVKQSSKRHPGVRGEKNSDGRGGCRVEVTLRSVCAVFGSALERFASASTSRPYVDDGS